MPPSDQVQRQTINGNNSNVDSMLSKLNQRLSDLAANLGVVPKPAQGGDQATPPMANVLNSTANHINWLQAAHNFLDDIEATLGPNK